jgi:ribosomal protein L11 methyltransferase
VSGRYAVIPWPTSDPMSWLQILFTVEPEGVPLLEAALEAAGAVSVTLDDAADQPLLEPPPGATPLWQAVRVSALFDDEPEALARLQALAAALGGYSLTPPVIEPIPDRAWERVWLDDFRPRCFGRRLWICPHGQPAGATDAVVVHLDPGLAFGTGHHPTTALCLEWLDAEDLTGTTLLDYGCGSGILGIAALKLGAAAVIAVDHDPQALEATRENALANGVAADLTACLPAGLAERADRLPVDRVVANILAGPLIELAPVLLDALRPGGRLALSGVLAGQAEGVTAAYAPRLCTDPVRLCEDWALIAGTREVRGPPCH